MSLILEPDRLGTRPLDPIWHVDAFDSAGTPLYFVRGLRTDDAAAIAAEWAQHPEVARVELRRR